MTELQQSLALDASYKPFPTFAEWSSRTEIDVVRWQRYTSELDSYEKLAPENLARSRHIATRAAALDTGALEGLYEVDRGFTYSVAIESTAWEIGLAEKGEEVRPLFEAQLHAYDYVLDLATQRQPISEAAIRILHEQICAAQATYRVVTAIGPQEQLLPKGKYKALPNHVRTREGKNHSYAPVDVTSHEMARLLVELRTEEFSAAHPVQQAAYAHYAFILIHPFSDGNGRVARALASAFTYRAISMPIVILSEDKSNYLDSLASADRGDYQAFLNFMLARSLDTINLVSEMLRSGGAPTIDQTIASIDRLYVTKAGYTQDEVESAGRELVELVYREFSRIQNEKPTSKLNKVLNWEGNNIQTAKPSYRSPTTFPSTFTVKFSTAAPISGSVARHFFLAIPRDAGGEDDLRILGHSNANLISARVDELLPVVSGVLRIRAGIVAERVIGEMLAELWEQAGRTLRGEA